MEGPRLVRRGMACHAQETTVRRLRRRSVRLAEYDYSQGGAYFVTICTEEKRCLFGRIADGLMYLNGAGCLVREEWLRTAILRDNVELDRYVVMPNHFHGLLLLHDSGMARHAPTTRRFASPQAGSLASIVGSFKSAATRRIRGVWRRADQNVWQRGYHEHVVRDEEDLHRLRKYIEENPIKWELDKYYRLS